MEVLRKLWIALRREQFRRDLQEEMRHHRELAEAEHRERGMSPEEARRASARQFGNAGNLADRSWEVVSLPFESTVRDLRYAARQLGRNRGFTATAVLTLAIGIGAVTAIFSVAYGVLIDPFPYKHVETLATPKLCRPDMPRCYWYVYTPRQFLAIERGTDVFSGVIGSTISDVNLTGAGDPQRLRGNYVTPNTFAVLGVAPALGREPSEADTAPGHGEVVLLSDRYWRSRFAGSPTVLGRVLMLNGQARTVIGVMPKRFLWRGGDVYLPIRMTESDSIEGQHYFTLVGRLKPGASEVKGSAELQAVFKDFSHADPREFPKNLRLGLMPFKEMFRSDLAGTVQLLLGAVSALLLIACVNVASLLLARAVHREHEFAVRAAIGASRGRLLRFALVESLLLPALALPVAICFAGLGLHAILRLVPPDTIPDEALISLNMPVLLASAGLALGTVALFGFLPASHGARQQPVAAMKGSRSSKTARQHRLLQSFVVSEIALCLGLLALAGLMVRSLVAVEHRPLPYSPEHTLAMDVTLDTGRYPTAASRRAFFRELQSRIAALPGVKAAAIDNEFPNYGTYSTEVAIDGKAGGTRNTTLLHATTPEYRAISSQVVLQGRYLSDADIADRAHNAVVSEEFAKRFFAGINPLGHSFRPLDLIEDDDNGAQSKPEKNAFTIVGVARDLPPTTPLDAQVSWPQIYLPLRSRRMQMSFLYLRLFLQRN